MNKIKHVCFLFTRQEKEQNINNKNLFLSFLNERFIKNI